VVNLKSKKSQHKTALFCCSKTPFLPCSKTRGQADWVLSKVTLLIYVMIMMVFLTSFWDTSSKKVNERIAISMAQDIASKIDFVVNSSGKNTFMYIPLPTSPYGADQQKTLYSVQITSKFVRVELENQQGYSLIIPDKYFPETTDPHYTEIDDSATPALDIDPKETNSGVVLLVSKQDNAIKIKVGE